MIKVAVGTTGTMATGTMATGTTRTTGHACYNVTYNYQQSFSSLVHAQIPLCSYVDEVCAVVSPFHVTDSEVDAIIESMIYILQ